jgi:integration host factor subunit alpha
MSVRAKEVRDMNKKTLTRADLSESLHRNIGLSRTESADMVNSVLDLISDALVDGQSVKLSSFGTFMVRAKRERIGRNPKTGEEVPITPRRVLVFRPSQVMKNVVNGLEGGDED